jgi:hypothetical protein
MSHSTLDCERQWREFTNYSISNPELSSRFQRLNVVLPWKPCKLDDVPAMTNLKAEAANFVSPKSHSTYDSRYRNCDEQLQVVADRLLATLFYFSVQNLEKTNDKWSVSGRMCCRLSPNLKTQFTAILSSRNRGNCIFRIRSQSGLITEMGLRKQDWNLDKFKVETSFTLHNHDRHRVIYIEQAFDKEERWNSISGFPRIPEVCINHSNKLQIS